MKESDLQIQVVATLSAMSASCGFAFFSIPNEGVLFGAGEDRAKSYGKITKLKKMGMTPGVADLVIIKDGRAFFLELKAPGKQQTKNQKIFMWWVMQCKSPYAVADNYETAIATLKRWKILTPAA